MPTNPAVGIFRDLPEVQRSQGVFLLVLKRCSALLRSKILKYR